MRTASYSSAFEILTTVTMKVLVSGVMLCNIVFIIISEEYTAFKPEEGKIFL